MRSLIIVALLSLSACAHASTPVALECEVGGCSGQLCVAKGKMTMSTCDWQPSYACYRDAECGVQKNGTCGWAQTPALEACISKAGKLTPATVKP